MATSFRNVYTSGIVVLYKPKGESSRTTLNRLQRAVLSRHKRLLESLHDEPKLLAELKLRKPPRVGHAGTLDPLAEGVLVACVGEATKLIETIQMLPKHYVGTFQLGVTSDTEDIEGPLTELSNPPQPSLEQLQNAAMQFVGRISQRPPAFSALKVDGKRAYQLARKGGTVELKPREIEVYQISLREYHYPIFRLGIECGSGTYVRSIGRDIGESLGSGAVMTALTRDWIGPFLIENALPPTVFDDPASEIWLERLLPLEIGVAHLPQVVLDDQTLHKIRHGQPVSLDDITSQVLENSLLAAFSAKHELVSLLEVRHDFSITIKKNFLLC